MLVAADLETKQQIVLVWFIKIQPTAFLNLIIEFFKNDFLRKKNAASFKH